MKELLDDKVLIIFAATILGLAVIFVPALNPDKGTIISSIVTGLFGIAVGRATK